MSLSASKLLDCCAGSLRSGPRPPKSDGRARTISQPLPLLDASRAQALVISVRANVFYKSCCESSRTWALQIAKDVALLMEEVVK